MNLQKANELVSVPDDVWMLTNSIAEQIKNLTYKINQHYVETNVYSKEKLMLIVFQGKLAARTMINPIFSTSTNDISIDLIAEFQKPVEWFTSENIKNIKEIIKKSSKEVFTNETRYEEGTKSLKFYFDSKLSNKKNMFIKLEYIIAATPSKIEKGKSSLEMIGLKRGITMSTDSLALIEIFNARDDWWRKKYGKSFNPRGIVKVIKALQYTEFNKELLKEIVLINQVIYSLENTQIASWKSIIASIKEGIELMNENGYVENVANTDIHIQRGKNFDYKKLMTFFSKIQKMNEDEIYSVLEKRLKSGKVKK